MKTSRTSSMKILHVISRLHFPQVSVLGEGGVLCLKAWHRQVLVWAPGWWGRWLTCRRLTRRLLARRSLARRWLTWVYPRRSSRRSLGPGKTGGEPADGHDVPLWGPAGGHPPSLLHLDGGQLPSLLLLHLHLMVEVLDNIANALSDQLKVLMWLDAIGRVNPGNLWPPCFFVPKLLLDWCLGVVSARHPWKLLLLGVETVEHLHFSFAVPPGNPKMWKENNFEKSSPGCRYSWCWIRVQHTFEYF